MNDVYTSCFLCSARFAFAFNHAATLTTLPESTYFPQQIMHFEQGTLCSVFIYLGFLNELKILFSILIVIYIFPVVQRQITIIHKLSSEV